MELEPSVELLLAPLDDLRSTGTAGMEARVTKLVLTSVMSTSLVVATVPELRWPELPSLLTW